LRGRSPMSSAALVVLEPAATKQQTPHRQGGLPLWPGASSVGRSHVWHWARSGLRGRRSERETLDRLVDAVRAGESRALVLRGDPGVGKTALLEYVLERAAGCRLARVAGVQSEMELAFAGLHQLCRPMLDRLDGLPGPQREALGTAFGLNAGDPPDRFLRITEGEAAGAPVLKQALSAFRSPELSSEERSAGSGSPAQSPVICCGTTRPRTCSL